MAYTMADFISLKSTDEVSYHNLSIVEKSSSGEMLLDIHNVIDDYLSELESICDTVTLLPNEVIYYQYRPWLLAYNIYGDSELWWIITTLNNCASPNEFYDIQQLQLPTGAALSNFLTSLVNSESTNIQNNRNKMTS